MSESYFDEETALLAPNENLTPQRSNYKQASIAAAGVLTLGLVYVAAVSKTSDISNTFSFANFVTLFNDAPYHNTGGKGTGNIDVLDRFNIECWDRPIKGFKGGNQFEYHCYNTKNSPSHSYQTSTGNHWNGEIQFLDRQKVFCNNHYFLTRFQGRRVGGDVTIDLTCKTYPEKNYRCEDRYTDYNQKGNTAYLDRHSVYCRDGEALRGWEGQTGNYNCRRNWYGGQDCDNGFRFKYICCSAEAPDPTPYPVPNPTRQPVVPPTYVPSAPPTLKPSAEPTKVPTPVPSANPTFKPSPTPTNALVDVIPGQGGWIQTRSYQRNKYDGNNLISLENAGPVSCRESKQALTGFQYGYNGNDGYWKYQCTGPLTSTTPVGEPIYKDAGSQWSGGLEFLDRQHLWCPDNTFLSEFIPRKKGTDIQIGFACLQIPNKHFTCVDKYTGFNDKGFDLIFLDRHRIECDSKTALKGWEGERSGNNIRFHYQCCGAYALYPTALPTLAPVSDPTNNPVAEPTENPVANPTLAPTFSPTHVPISDPTEQPIADPTQNPIAEPTEKPSEYPSTSPIPDPTQAPTEVPEEDHHDHHETIEEGVTTDHDVPMWGDISRQDTDDGNGPNLPSAKNTCAFTYIKGVTSDPPSGCVLIADKDINYLKDGQKSNAAYACNNVELTNANIGRYALLDSISTIFPGPGTTAKFYTGANLDGANAEFNNKHHPELTNIKFNGFKNDGVGSISISSKIEGYYLPSECTLYKRLRK